MSDFVVEGGFDDRSILEGFKKIVTAGTEAGRKVGAGFEDELNRFGKRSVASLQAELGKLQSRQLRVNIDSSAFAKTEARIQEIQRLIDLANKKKLALQFDPASLNGLNNKLRELQNRSLDLRVGTKEFQVAQLQADALQRKIQQLGRTPVTAGSLEALNRELQELQSRQLRVNVDSRAFGAVDAQIRQVQERIDGVNKRRILVNADPGSVVAVRQRLQEINQQLERVAIGSKAFNILSAQAQAAERQLGLASRQTRNIAGDLLDLALPATGTLGAILALGQALRFAADQARQFDSAGAAVRTLGVDSAALAERLKAVSRETGGARSEIELLQAAYDVASSGFADAASASQILEASARGATGGFSDINTVANATTSVLNAYGLSADQASSLVDKFIQTQNDGKITVAQLAQQIGKLAPIAASAGVSIDEFGAAIAAATVAGVQPEAAVTGLRQAISNIIKPTAEAEALASRLGIGFSAQALKAKGLQGVLTDVATATKGSAGLNLELFGTVEALTAVQPLLNDQLGRFNKFLVNQQNSADVAKKATDQVANTVEGATKRIQGSLSNLAMDFGKLSTPALVEILNSLGVALGLAADNLKRLLELPGGADALFGALSKANKGTALLTAGQEGLAKASLKLTETFVNPAGLVAIPARLAAGAAEAKILGKDLGRVGDVAKSVAGKVGELPAATGKVVASQESLNSSLAREVAILREIGSAREALTKVQQQVPLGNVTAQLQGAQSLITFAGALAGLEESRFATVRARNQFEIDNATKLGITQEGIASRETANLELQKQGLIAKYQATLQQKKLEQVTLDLKQRQAQIEAQLLVLDQQRAVIKAKGELSSANASLDPKRIADAENLLEQEQISLGLVQQKLDIIRQIAPIEQGVAQANRETAQQQLLQQGAALGIESTLRNITPELQAQSTAWRESVQSAASVNGGLNTIRGSISGAARDTQALGSGFIQVGNQIRLFGTSKIDATTENAAGSAGNLAGGIGDAAGQARTLAGNMNDAAGNAERLYQWVSSAAGLPASRFTGGPVDAGGRYRINDGPGGRSLGQESFLSRAGDLSLIRNPLNSMWTAPTAGIVLPAAVTDTLKARGAFSADRGVARRAATAAGGILPGGAANTARLELAVTNLAAQVQALERKTWNVGVQVKNSPGSQQVRMMNSLMP